MKLQAYIQDGAGGMAALTPSASGVQVSSGYYIAADVDALLARIRAAGDGLALAAADVSRLSGLPDSMPNLGALGAARMTLNEAIAAWQTVKGAE